jgi:ABC-type branched-subunit amino acid transport system substrate-binding protein
MKKLTFWIGILCVSVLIPPLSVGAADAVPGVTDNEVVVGWTTPLSGPAALWGVTGLGGKAWADYVNDQGGIHGRKIKIILKDDGYNPARALVNLQEMKGNIFAVCGLLGTAILNAAKDFFPENNIPLITAYGDISIWARQPRDKLRPIFIAYPDYEDEAEYIATYAVSKLGSEKIALFYQNDDYGRMAWLGVKKALEAMPGKGKLVTTVPYEVTERALGTHALKLKESGADTILIYATPSHGALILKEMAKADYRPKAMATFTLGDPIMYRIAGNLWEGTYIALPGNSGVPGTEPAADRVVKILKKYNTKLAGKEYLSLFGAVSMMHLVEGLKNAGRDLTPETMIKGMEMIKNWRPEGIGAPVTYAPDQRHGNNASRMGQARNGKIVPIEPFTVHRAHF